MLECLISKSTFFPLEHIYSGGSSQIIMLNTFREQIKTLDDHKTVLLPAKVITIIIRNTSWHISVVSSPENSDIMLYGFSETQKFNPPPRSPDFLAVSHWAQRRPGTWV